MAGGNSGGAMLHRAFEAGAAGHLADGELLGRFVEGQDRAALEVLVRRHGAMVWGTCLRVLRDHHDAEDAFQVTFGVLARRAGAVAPRELVGPWLYGVAYRTAVKARMTRGKRRGREAPVACPPEPEPASSVQGDDERMGDLDRALSRLPDKYRSPIVLCELEGLTHREAADQLGWPVGTLAGRLSRGRAILARALGRGASPRPTAPVVPLITSTSWPTALVAPTVRSVGLAPAGPASWVVRLWFRTQMHTERIARNMLLAPGKLISGAALAAVFAGFVAAVAARPGPPPAPGTPSTRQVPADPPAAAVDPALAKAVAGRIVRAAPVVKDSMVLAYMPGWDFGNVDNLGVASNDGGVRTLVECPKLAPADLAQGDLRFVLALYARAATAKPRPGPILAFEVEQVWPERTSWNTLPDYATEPGATYPFEPGEGWKLFDVTPIVRRGADKPGAEPHGILLRFLSEDRKAVMGVDRKPAGTWSGYQIVSREAEGEWKGRRPLFLVVEPPKK